jgi:CheY-like chemotaxis protein
VDVAFDGTDGLWLATEGSYDLIVLDLMLPGLNGFQVCGRVREAGDWTPILVLTAKDGDLDEAEALDTGADDGPGIDPSDRERVFDCFARLDPSRSDDAGASGLGLAIAREIVIAHGGTIDVDDAPSGGARFTVRLPAPDPV